MPRLTLEQVQLAIDMEVLAAAFAGAVRAIVSTDQWRMLREMNRRNPHAGCATGEFCDAIGLLLLAYEVAAGREGRADDYGTPLFNGAWECAREKYFTEEEPK